MAERGLDRDYSDLLSDPKDKKRGRKREMAEFASFSVPTKCHRGQLESSGFIHPEHLLVKHAADKQVQTNTKKDVNIKGKKDIICPAGAFANIEIEKMSVVQAGRLSEALMTVIKQLKLHLHLKGKQE